jgi:thiopeptide-type bacteriocin biosynthesis protein
MTMAADGHDWLYYKVFPGAESRIDDLVRGLVRLETMARAERWHFLRYVDERGTHLRLRLRGPREVVDALQDELDERLRALLPHVAAATASPLERLVQHPLHVPVRAQVLVERGLYEPEWGKFGGVAGVDEAERLFQVASELALAVVLSGGAPRIAVGLALMKAGAAGALADRAAREALWRRHARYWSAVALPEGGAPVREAFVAWYARLRAQAASLLAGPAWAQRARRWGDELSTSAARAAGPGIDRARWCALHSHLLLNRLGVPPADEALLAAVLARAEATA